MLPSVDGHVPAIFRCKQKLCIMQKIGMGFGGPRRQLVTGSVVLNRLTSCSHLKLVKFGGNELQA